jgi:hypothetical protein
LHRWNFRKANLPLRHSNKKGNLKACPYGFPESTIFRGYANLRIGVPTDFSDNPRAEIEILTIIGFMAIAVMPPHKHFKKPFSIRPRNISAISTFSHKRHKLTCLGVAIREPLAITFSYAHGLNSCCVPYGSLRHTPTPKHRNGVYFRRELSTALT